MGLLGALALALKHRQRAARGVIPDEISPAIFATRSVSTSQGELVYHVSGSGEPLVFLHGFFLGASSYEWSKVYSRAAINHEVIAPDLIGFGESERPSKSVDAADHVEYLAEFLREVVPQRPAVLIASGVSANLSLLLASRHPELVSRMVLFLPTDLRDSNKCRTMGIVRRSRLPGVSYLIYRRHIAQLPFIRSWLESYGFANPDKITPETLSVLVNCAQQYGAEHAIFHFFKKRHAFDVSSHLSSILAPVHILWPAKAAGFHPSDAVNLCRHLPRASMEILPEASAFAPMESPDDITAAVSRWIDGDLTALQTS
jgi:pimeloyl-ACP methyl ester carboxylesterase